MNYKNTLENAAHLAAIAHAHYGWPDEQDDYNKVYDRIDQLKVDMRAHVDNMRGELYRFEALLARMHSSRPESYAASLQQMQEDGE